ncbi:AAA family ATPase, partial [Streptomyces sp. NPDC127098]|uniref:AAA family ATPase n=1 Tax=Streptomyces sp. NPDC127098 TaxID=3347137 RepID=UPI00364BBD78
MRLHRLTLTAFGPFGTAQHVDFDRLSAAGLFLFHGATGAGKSSILDAVCFALYGSVPGARQQATLALRSDHAAPGTATEVVLDLTVGGRRLEITRAPEQDRPKRRGTGTTRERARALLREHDPATGAWRALSRSHQEIGEELAGLLGGMSREQFCQVVLLPQGEFARFLRAGAEERAKLLGRLFGTRRFAAAEAHLAEQRSAAAERVRAADERLLALTNRVLQAAGPDAAELGPAPDPQDAPVGTDPAQPLLGWAAQARCTARERHTIAVLALEHAEAAHAAAERRHTETAERARLQREHARARERAAALAAGELAHAADVARLDRAQAAESVAPALGLRAAADAEHRAAALAEREARAALPPDLADSPAAVLADRERAAREALGALAAARAAEARAGAIDAELAALAEEAAADEASLADAERRLAPWPAEAERLRHDLERVLGATATADAVAQRLTLARDRLAAAHRRDRLSVELTAAGEALLAARETAADAYAHWLDLKERRLRDIAAELAAALHPGRPCPVCGAEEHPGPARPTSDHVDRAAEEAARTAHQAAERHRARAEQELAALRADHAAATAEAGDEPAEALAGTVRALEAELAAARAEAAGEAAARQAVAAAEAAHARLLDQRGAAERRGAARAARQAALTAELTTLRAEVDRAR